MFKVTSFILGAALLAHAKAQDHTIAVRLEYEQFVHEVLINSAHLLILFIIALFRLVLLRLLISMC
jgi:hypothetical protein